MGKEDVEFMDVLHPSCVTTTRVKKRKDAWRLWDFGASGYS